MPGEDGRARLVVLSCIFMFACCMARQDRFVSRVLLTQLIRCREIMQALGWCGCRAGLPKGLTESEHSMRRTSGGYGQPALAQHNDNKRCPIELREFNP